MGDYGGNFRNDLYDQAEKIAAAKQTKYEKLLQKYNNSMDVSLV